MNINKGSSYLIKKTLLAFITLFGFYLLGFVKGCAIGFFHELFTPHLYFYLAVITCATFSMTFLFLIPKKQRDKIIKPLVICAFTIIVLLFATNINKIIPKQIYSSKTIEIVIRNIEKSDIYYTNEIENISMELRNSTHVFAVTSKYPKLASEQVIELQIENIEKTIRKIQYLSPPKKYSQKQQLLYSIALIRFDNLVKYKKRDYMDTVYSNERIQEIYTEKCSYLHYGDCGRIKSI